MYINLIDYLLKGLLGIVLFLRKRAKGKLATTTSAVSIISSHESVEIDWDEIEKHYAEIDSEHLTLKHSSLPNAADIASPTYIKKDSETVSLSPNTLTIPMSPATVAVPSSPIKDQHDSSAMVVNITRPINNNIQSMRSINPDAIDEPSSKQNVVKPDIGTP